MTSPIDTSLRRSIRRSPSPARTTPSSSTRKYQPLMRSEAMRAGRSRRCQRAASLKHGPRGWLTWTVAVPTVNTSPTWTSFSRSPSTERFSPKAPRGSSLPSRRSQRGTCSTGYAHAALSGPPWTVRSACSSPSNPPAPSRRGPSTGRLKIALRVVRPRHGMGAGVPVCSEATRPLSIPSGQQIEALAWRKHPDLDLRSVLGGQPREAARRVGERGAPPSVEPDGIEGPPVDRDGDPRAQQRQRTRRGGRVEVSGPEARAPAPDRHERDVEGRPGEVRHAGEEAGVPGEVHAPWAARHIAQRVGAQPAAEPPSPVVGAGRGDGDVPQAQRPAGLQLDDLRAARARDERSRPARDDDRATGAEHAQ